MAVPMLLIALAIAILFVACSSSSNDSVEPTSTVSPTPPKSADPTSVPPTPKPQPTAVPATPLTGTTVAAPTPTTAPTVAPTIAATATPSPLGDEFFLTLIEPVELDIFTSSPNFDIVGQTRVDAVVTVNDEIVTPNTEGIFEHTVTLEEGISIIEVVGSVSTNEQTNYVITVVYLP